jgi:hypothetical protein
VDDFFGDFDLAEDFLGCFGTEVEDAGFFDWPHLDEFDAVGDSDVEHFL